MNNITHSTLHTILKDKTGAQTSAILAPFPHCSTLVEPLVNVIQLCEKMPYRYSAEFLRTGCCHLVFMHMLRGNYLSPERLQIGIDEIRIILLFAQTTLQRWVDAGRLWTFIKDNTIRRDIEECTRQVNDLLTAFQRTSAEINDWQVYFDKDLKIIKEYVSQELANKLKEHPNSAHKYLAGMKTIWPNEPNNAADDELRRKMREMQSSADDLSLPDLKLKHGEVRRMGEHAIGETQSMDIWAGYLADEKVTIKYIRAASNSPDTIRRFEREVRIWGDILKKDGGQYLVPFIGYCIHDGPLPYMVSPWMVNGTAIAYVKRDGDSLNYLNFIRHIANGVAVLHCHDPPVIHGDLNGSNIYVNGMCKPLIADFGVSQIIEDITDSVECSQSVGPSSSYRWRAPELCIGQGTLSTSADIYAFSMTVLELFTHKPPFADIKHTSEVNIRAFAGERPKRPVEQRLVARGLDDKLWNLLCWCWSAEPTERPTIQQVVAELSSM